jgi:hypothetical protein
MLKKKALLAFIFFLLFYFLTNTFAQNKNTIPDEKKNLKALVEQEQSKISLFGLDKAKSFGLIEASAAEKFDFLGTFHYYAPILVKHNMLYFLDYLHSVPLNKEEESTIFSIDDVQFELKLGFKRFVHNNLLMLGYYSHRSAIKVDQKGFANMDSLNVGLETAGFTLRNIDPDINWNAELGFVLHNSEPFKGVQIKGGVAFDIVKINKNANIGLDIKLDSIISSYKNYGEGEAKFRINFFNRDGNITSLFASYVKSNHIYGLDAQGFNFGISWEQGMPPGETASALSQWEHINGLFFLGICNGINGTLHVDLGADWILAEGEKIKAEANIQGWGWILSQGANNAFYAIIGGTTLYYKELYGFGFAYNHRSNHLIHQSFTNPASSINYTDFVACSKGWHISNRKYGIQIKKPFTFNLNYYFSIGRVASAQFVESGSAALKYGVRLDLPKVKEKVIPFIRYYGETVGSYQQNNIQIGLIMKRNWYISASYYQDEQAYIDDNYFIIGIGKIY